MSQIFSRLFHIEDLFENYIRLILVCGAFPQIKCCRRKWKERTDRKENGERAGTVTEGKKNRERFVSLKD